MVKNIALRWSATSLPAVVYKHSARPELGNNRRLVLFVARSPIAVAGLTVAREYNPLERVIIRSKTLGRLDSAGCLDGHGCWRG